MRYPLSLAVLSVLFLSSCTSTVNNTTSTGTTSSTSTATLTTDNNRPTPPGGFGSGGPGPRGNSGSLSGPVGGGGDETDASGAYDYDGISCGYTPQTTEGPYYVRGTAALTDGNLNYDNLAGEKIKISGYVYVGTGKTTPLSGATVDIWHADTDGKYHPQSNGQASSYTADQIALRGSVTTDANGYYEFTSIFPGHYTGRTRHIHIRAYNAEHTGVITQLITPTKDGDSDVPATDSIAKSLPSCNKISFTTVDGVMTSSFNFHLK